MIVHRIVVKIIIILSEGVRFELYQEKDRVNADCCILYVVVSVCILYYVLIYTTYKIL